jgi:hypothetical protein
LHKVAKLFGKDRQIQQDILYALGLNDYGFIDSDLSDTFLAIAADTPIDQAREQVRKQLLTEIIRAIDDDRATTGLKPMDLVDKHEEIAVRNQQIVELRKAEMQEVVIGVNRKRKRNSVDLSGLALTAYGYETLASLGMRLKTNLDGLEQIKGVFAGLGFDLKTGEDVASAVKMSKEQKISILWIIQNTGRDWSNINRSHSKHMINYYYQSLLAT